MNSGDMAPTGSPTMDKCDVTVKLTAREAGSQFVVPARQITLTKDRPVVRIGRASKQESKGFVAAEDNAWFDSPVMSREHAELTADFDEKAILIEDTGSLHGTFRRSEHEDKEDRLCARQKVSLKTGDTIRFGTDIYRGQQTFPPCTVHVELSWNQENLRSAISSRATPTNTFSVPDYDDEDLISDNDDIIETDNPLPSQMNLPQANVSIDLTVGSPLPKTNSPSKTFPSSRTVGRLDSDVIDLTSEPESHEDRHSMELSPAPEAFFASSDASSPMSVHIHGYSESSAEEVSSDDEPHHGHTNTSTPRSEVRVVYSPLYETDSEAGWDTGDVPASDTFDPIDDTASDLERTDGAGRSSDENGGSSDDSMVGESEHEFSTSDELDEEDEGGEDNLHNVPYWEEDMSSDSEDEDEDDPMDSSLFDKTHSPTVAVQNSSSPIMPNALCSGAILQSATSPHPVCANGAHGSGPTVPYILGGPMTQMSGAGTYSTTTYLPDALAIDQRHPSPSDAVMAKPSPVEAKTCTPSSTTQALGERTGKYEFFAARDHNRASVMSNPLIQATPTTNTSKTAPTTTLPPWREPAPARDAMADIVLETRHGQKQPPLLTSAWTPIGEAFLKEPHNYPLPLSDERTRLQSPDLDMTSAATFVESKKKPENDASRSRRRLAVKFLLSQESKEASPIPSSGNDNSPRPPKRSYDEVFSEVEDQSYDVRSSPAPTSPRLARSNIVLGTGPIGLAAQSSGEEETQAEANVSINDELMQNGQAISAVTEGTTTPAVVFAAPTDPVAVRPAKRRRFSKFAKYASVSVVSGVTSAALLFAGLAATAPQIV